MSTESDREHLVGVAGVVLSICFYLIAFLIVVMAIVDYLREYRQSLQSVEPGDESV